uniref:Uncharacterized protein n=1 Tax=viral metagenome TaxID=1070528 RepID=A0A6M3JXL0_9ZZZZ
MKATQAAKMLLLLYLERVNSNEWVTNTGANQPEKKLIDSGDDFTLAQRLKHQWMIERDEGNSLFNIAFVLWQNEPQACIDCFGLAPDAIIDMFD